MKVTDVSPGKINPRRVNIYLDGKYVLSMDDVDALVHGIKSGRDISPSELRELVRTSDISKAKTHALNILSRKSVTTAMLCKELRLKNYEEDIVSEVAEELSGLGYLDDYAYTLSYLEMCRDKLWGERKIRYELGERGVDKNTIEDALCEFTLPGSREIALEIENRYRGEDITDARIRQKIVRFFAQRGFDYSQVDRAIALYTENKKD